MIVAPTHATKKDALGIEARHVGIYPHQVLRWTPPISALMDLLRKLGLHVPLTRESALLASNSKPYTLLRASRFMWVQAGGSRAPGFQVDLALDSALSYPPSLLQEGLATRALGLEGESNGDTSQAQLSQEP